MQASHAGCSCRWKAVSGSSRSSTCSSPVIPAIIYLAAAWLIEADVAVTAGTIGRLHDGAGSLTFRLLGPQCGVALRSADPRAHCFAAHLRIPRSAARDHPASGRRRGGCRMATRVGEGSALPGRLVGVPRYPPMRGDDRARPTLNGGVTFFGQAGTVRRLRGALRRGQDGPSRISSRACTRCRAESSSSRATPIVRDLRHGGSPHRRRWGHRGSPGRDPTCSTRRSPRTFASRNRCEREEGARGRVPCGEHPRHDRELSLTATPTRLSASAEVSTVGRGEAARGDRPCCYSRIRPVLILDEAYGARWIRVERIVSKMLWIGDARRTDARHRESALDVSKAESSTVVEGAHRQRRAASTRPPRTTGGSTHSSVAEQSTESQRLPTPLHVSAQDRAEASSRM